MKGSEVTKTSNSATPVLDKEKKSNNDTSNVVESTKKVNKPKNKKVSNSDSNVKTTAKSVNANNKQATSKKTSSNVKSKSKKTDVHNTDKSNVQKGNNSTTPGSKKKNTNGTTKIPNKNIEKKSEKDTSPKANPSNISSKKVQEDESLNDSNDKSQLSTELISLEDKEYKLAEQTLSKKSHKKALLIAIPCSLFVLSIIIFCFIFSLLNLHNANMMKGIKIEGIDISGLSKDEALSKIRAEADSRLSTNLVLQHNDFETTLLASQFDAQYDVDSAIDYAYSIGRSGNILQNNFSILHSMVSGNNIDIDVSYNHDSLLETLNGLSVKLPDSVIQPAHFIEDDYLIITNGKHGVSIDSIKLINIIIDRLNSFYNIEEPIDIPVYEVYPKSIDIDAIYNEIHSEPSDAYYTTDPLMVYPHKDGLDFEISLDEAKALLEQPQDEYSIKLKKLYANIRTSDIGLEAFPDSISSFSSSFSSSNSNRSTNIRLAAEKVDGVVLMPGETFSYNSTVGRRTAAAGFKEAGVYVNGEVSTDYGGGICQVSSTLYNAVLRANLEIVERHNHYFQTGYVKAGTDATVSWGALDFQFKNNRTYPIKLVCSGTGGKVRCEIRGLYQDPEYEVEIYSKVIQTIRYPTVYQKSSSAPGTVLQNGSNGCKTETYKILKLNGEVISETLLSKDTYNPHKKVIASD